MTLDLTRRWMLGGIGAALVSAAAPGLPIIRPPRALPILTQLQSQSPYHLTAQHLLDSLSHWGKSIANWAPDGRISDEEREALALRIDELLWEIRPAGLLLRVKATPQQLASGFIWISEPCPGEVHIMGGEAP